MNYEKTRQRLMEWYPSMYVSEWDVLNHLFFILGNGYEWVDGELCDGSGEEDIKPYNTADYYRKEIEEASKLSLGADYISYLKERLDFIVNSTPEEKRSAERERRLFHISKRRGRQIGSNPTSHPWFLLEDSSIGIYCYPISEFSQILHIPEDIKPDWMYAVKKLIGYCGKEVVLSDKDWDALMNNTHQELAVLALERRKALTFPSTSK